MEVERCKDEICDVCHKMWQQGWTASNDGNVSVKLDKDVYLITPGGISKSFITKDKLLIVDGRGAVIEGAEGYKPSSEMKMHLRCYEQREDVGGVVHAHPPIATGYAVAGQGLDNYCMIEAVLSLGAVPVVPYATPSTDEVPDSITPYLKNHDALLLANHGAITVGENLMTAYYKMETLEQYAKVSLVARLLGGAREIPEDKVRQLLDLRDNYYHLSGRHPDYK